MECDFLQNRVIVVSWRFIKIIDACYQMNVEKRIIDLALIDILISMAFVTNY